MDETICTAGWEEVVDHMLFTEFVLFKEVFVLHYQGLVPGQNIHSTLQCTDEALAPADDSVFEGWGGDTNAVCFCNDQLLCSCGKRIGVERFFCMMELIAKHTRSIAFESLVSQFQQQYLLE